MRTKPIKIVLAYITLCVGWILVSDHFIHLLSFSNETINLLNTVKGILFVFITGGLLYVFSKKQQRVLINSKNQYKNLFFSNPNPLWIYDINTLQFLEVNSATIRNYGYTKSEFKKMTILDLHPIVSHQKVREIIESFPKTHHISGNWKHLKKNGKVMIVSVKAHRISFRNRDSVMVMAQDITLRVLQEKKLKQIYKVEKELRTELEEKMHLLKQSMEEKTRFAEVIDRINNIVLITDTQGVITWVNQAFVKHTGYSEIEAIGKFPQFLYGPKTDPDMQRKIMEGVAAMDFSTYEILNYTKNGQEYWIELSISAIYNEENQIERFISIQNIITERKQREEQIKEQNRILRKLAWTNSHSLRKPVASIMSLLMLSKGAERKEEIEEIHYLMETCTSELDGIIKEIGQNINQSEIG